MAMQGMCADIGALSAASAALGVARRCNLAVHTDRQNPASARLRTLLCSASSTSGTQLHTDFNGGSTGSVRARL